MTRLDDDNYDAPPYEEPWHRCRCGQPLTLAVEVRARECADCHAERLDLPQIRMSGDRLVRSTESVAAPDPGESGANFTRAEAYAALAAIVDRLRATVRT